MGLLGDIRLRPAEAANLDRLAKATDRIAGALEAIVAKINEPEPPEVPGELHDAIGAQTETATQVRDAIQSP